MDDISPIEKEDIENKIIDWIDVSSSDRLIIFKPENNKKNIDLIVKKKSEYKAKEISLQINGSAAPVTGPDFIKDVVENSFVPDKALYLLFVYFDEIKQDISSYFWVVPSLFFRDSVDPIKLPDGKTVMRFQAPTDLKKQSKYSRFLVNKKDFGKILLKIIESKDNFEFSGLGVKMLNLQNIKKFIAQARQNTFAGNGVAIDDPRLIGSVQLEFQKADFFYRDICFWGEKSFIGQEIVYQDSKPVWGMNYIGGAIGKLETAFLKESLFKLFEKCRMGGVCEYEKRELKYQDQGQGSLEDFFGREQIFQNGKNIYKLNYQGGLI